MFVPAYAQFVLIIVCFKHAGQLLGCMHELVRSTSLQTFSYPCIPFVVFPVLPLLTFIFSVFCYTSREFFLASSVLPACKLPDVHRSLDTVWLKHLGMNFSYANMCYHVIYMWSEPPDYVKQKHNSNYNVTTVNGHTIFTLFNKWPQNLHFVQ